MGCTVVQLYNSLAASSKALARPAVPCNSPNYAAPSPTPSTLPPILSRRLHPHVACTPNPPPRPPSFPSRRDNAKIRTCIGGLADLHSHLRRSLDAGVSVLLTRLTPRLRTALNVFEGQSSLIQYELGEEAFAAGEEGHNAFSTEFLPVLSSILAPYQVRPRERRTGDSAALLCPK